MTAAGGEQILYLYGVVSAGQQVPVSDGARLEAIPFCSLVAVVEPVPSCEFSSEVLEHKLQCLDWVGPLARKHTAVLEDLMRAGPIVPARLCTLFSSARALAESLAEHEPQFHDALEVLDGRQEWGLKVFCDGAQLRAATAERDPEVQALDAAAAAASPGQAFVLRKRRDGRVSERMTTRIDEVLDAVLDAVLDVVADTRCRMLLSEAATGRRDEMVLNEALLVDVATTASLHDTIAAQASRLGAEGFTLELTGPWPPYSFCDGAGASEEAT